MKTLLEVWRLLDPAQRRRVAWLCVLALGMALSTVGGVTAVLPFLAALGDALSGSRSGLLGPLYDGLGFETSPAALARGHYGLTTMRERAEHLSGRFRVVSEHGEGTLVEVVVPTPGLESAVEATASAG